MKPDHFHDLFYNEDGTIKQSILDSMDVYSKEQEEAENQYIKEYLDEDYGAILSYVKINKSVDDDEFMYNKEKAITVNDRIVDLSQFGNIVFSKFAVDIEEKFDSSHTGARKYKELRIDLFCGQGSFYRFSNYEFVNNGGRNMKDRYYIENKLPWYDVYFIIDSYTTMIVKHFDLRETDKNRSSEKLFKYDKKYVENYCEELNNKWRKSGKGIAE